MGLGPGFVWLQVRTQTPISAWDRVGGGTEGVLRLRQGSRTGWASPSVKGLIRDVCFKRQISSGSIDVSTVFGK